MCTSTGRQTQVVDSALNVGDFFVSPYFSPNDLVAKANAIENFLAQLKFTKKLCEVDKDCKAEGVCRPTNLYSSHDDGLDLHLDDDSEGKKYYSGMVLSLNVFSLRAGECK